jgi:hypothetical protein
VALHPWFELGRDPDRVSSEQAQPDGPGGAAVPTIIEAGA